MAKLTPDDILRLSEPIEKVYSDIVDALLINMAKHFNSSLFSRQMQAAQRSASALLPVSRQIFFVG